VISANPSSCICEAVTRAINRTTSGKRSSTHHAKLPLRHLSVSLEVESVVSLPGLSSASSCLVISVTFAQTTRLLASCGETSRFAVLVDGVDDPANARIAADGLVLRVDENDLEVLVGGVLVNPVRVENTQVGATTSDTLLSSRLEGSLVLELVHTLVGRLAVCSTLWYRPLATSTTDTDTVDDIALLGLVTQTACLIWTRWAGGAMDDV